MSKYTAEMLAPIVANEESVYGVLRALGLKPTGGSHHNIKRLIASYNLDTGHFLGRGHGKGLVAQNKLHWKKVLVLNLNVNYRINPGRLRRALLESGVKEQCSICKQGPFWNRHPLRLQIDHRDGHFRNNRRSNLRFLCPNCHSQTSNFGICND